MLLDHVVLDLNEEQRRQEDSCLGGATFPSCKVCCILQRTASRVPWQSRRARHGTRHCHWHGQSICQSWQLRGMLHGLLHQAWSEVGMCHGNVACGTKIAQHAHQQPTHRTGSTLSTAASLLYAILPLLLSAGFECWC